MFHKILVALDHSSQQPAVFQEALALAKAMNAQLLLLHVITLEETDILLPSLYPYSPTVSQGMIDLYNQQREELQNRGLNLLKALEAEATAAGVTTEFTQNLGSPGQVICTLARNYRADAIVMGRRGHSKMSELVLGSVSNYVLHHAPCSVVVIQGHACSVKLVRGEVERGVETGESREKWTTSAL
jgi:nucleotide-binding universal stress UspA family protein